MEIRNPFDLVKATDLSDVEIEDYFVDFPGAASLLARIKPTSPMPMVIFGGKGSGKTHLMRYLSFPLQVRRHGDGEAGRKGISSDKYLGIYFKCGSLNAYRFSGKGQPQDIWSHVFAYYMELWISQMLLRTVIEIHADCPETVNVPALLEEISALLDVHPEVPINQLEDHLTHFHSLQRIADIAINNCGISKKLDLKIVATPGNFAIGLPKVLARHVPTLRDVLFVYLADEFENLTEHQQEYFNTLVREREPPVTIKIGVRLYGIRSVRILNSGEENRKDSEYEEFRLDTELRNRREDAQLEFATQLVRKRLVINGTIASKQAETFAPSEWFEIGDQDSRLSAEGRNIAEKYVGRDTPAIASLREKLIHGIKIKASPGLDKNEDVNEIIDLVRVPSNIFIEKVSVFLLYRAWARKQSLQEAAHTISQSATEYLSGSGSRSPHAVVMKHFRTDILAQLYRETDQRQRYVGFGTFVKMSAGLPRALLTILKHIYTWSTFLGEDPFRSSKVSLKAQTDGVAQASEWFFSDARAPGPVGTEVRDAMTKLGQLLRDLRFSDKPSESSLSSFSVDLLGAQEPARENLANAENWSMLIKIAGGQHDRNEGRVDDKYQVHPMLAPRWDLPVARRGAIALSGDEVNAIFGTNSGDAFERVIKRRLSPMLAPMFSEADENGSRKKEVRPLVDPSLGLFTSDE